MPSLEKILSRLSSLDFDTVLKPSIEDSSLDPSALQFFDWIDSQVLGTQDSLIRDDDTDVVESLHSIAIEEEERAILWQHTVVDIPSPEDILTNDYLPPSKLKQHARYIQVDTELIQQETRRLRGRIAQKKAASDDLTKIIKTIQREIYDVDTQTNESEARLLELSIKADTTIAANIHAAEAIFTELGSNNGKDWENSEVPAPKQDDTSSALSTSLKKLNKIEASVQIAVDQLRVREMEVASFYQRRGGEAQIHLLDAERLEKSLTAISEKCKDREIENYWLGKEIERICQVLDATSSKSAGEAKETLDALLFGSGHITEDQPSLFNFRDLDPMQLVRDSWNVDQLSILVYQEQSLEQCAGQLQELINSLQSLHSSLETVATHAQEVEAVLAAFGEEMEELVLPFPSSTAGTSDQSQQGLQAELLRVLQRYRDDSSFCALELRSCTKQDVLDELDLLKRTMAETRLQEMHWATNMIAHLATRPIHEELPRVYSNSAMNTSPPFSMKRASKTLLDETQIKVGKLNEATSVLERDHRESVSKGSHLKRLDAFIEHWAP